MGYLVVDLEVVLVEQALRGAHQGWHQCQLSRHGLAPVAFASYWPCNITQTMNHASSCSTFSVTGAVCMRPAESAIFIHKGINPKSGIHGS